MQQKIVNYFDGNINKVIETGAELSKQQAKCSPKGVGQGRRA